MNILKSATSPNPFRTLLAGIDSETWQVVTLEFLRHVSEIINKDEKLVVTYGEAFQVLEFLAQAGAIELVPTDPKSPQEYKLRKVM